LKPAAEARREEEKKLVKDGKPVTFAGWTPCGRKSWSRSPRSC